MPHDWKIWIFPLAFVAIMLIRAVADRAPGLRKRIQFIQHYVDSRGYTLLNPQIIEFTSLGTWDLMKAVNSGQLRSGAEGLGSIEEFKEGPGSGNPSAFSFSHMNREITVFPYSRVRGSGKNRSVSHYRVAKIGAEGLPIFRLSPAHRWSDRLLVWLRKFTQSRKPIEIPEYPRFSKLYAVSTSDEANTRRFFNDSKIGTLEAELLKGEVETTLNYLVYFEHAKFAGEATYDEFVERVKHVADVLIA